MAASGSMKAYRKAYCEYYPIVYSVLLSRLRNGDDAEDICQEVFIRFLDNFDSIESHRGWLLKAIEIEISNYYRKKSSRNDEAVDVAEFVNDINLAFENGFRDARIVINEAIENMENYDSEEDRTLFDLIAVYGFSYKEAGKYLGMTRWQAEYRYGQIEARIVDYLKKMGIKEVFDLL